MTVSSLSSLATLLVTATGVGLLAAPGIIDTPTRLIWNVSASAPIGLYALHRDSALAVGDWVLVMPPARLQLWLTERSYLAPNVPLVKRVAALSGQTVCRRDRLITIDGVAIAPARANDRDSRPLPVWQGCQLLAETQAFLMTWDEPDSLDGRYFGPLARTAIFARLTPVLTTQAP